MGSFDPLIDAPAPDPVFAPLVATGAASVASPSQAAFSELAAGAGQVITFLGDTYAGIVLPPTAKETAMLAEGPAIDASNAEVRAVVLPCSQFVGGAYPAEGGAVTLTEGGVATVFTVLARTVRQVAGTDISLRLLLYRTPAPGSATVAPSGEVGAGAPKLYVPPVNPY